MLGTGVDPSTLSLDIGEVESSAPEHDDGDVRKPGESGGVGVGSSHSKKAGSNTRPGRSTGPTGSSFASFGSHDTEISSEDDLTKFDDYDGALDGK